MKRILATMFLVLSGGIAALVGTWLMLDPNGFLALSGISGTSDVNRLSEARAPGGFLLVTAAVILFTALRPGRHHIGYTLSALLYLGYAMGRMTGLLMDGWPDTSLIGALGLELVFGLSALAALMNRRRCA
ncbi:DUF4345 domain-containing protein [Hyphobacterium sp. HN65]|uniref:DUF4345 domain-containing protein n=1 Tax=Hyphobacterium lacteum TaxID=3116575 RepID=A0ABU7LNP0_9PROT|nr:DUF4345 domain-containing protein [Hyphobacterium sp. HN65]MEE2525525.1 DUF4345 domain-containing protein [Hyphobacterium sp. HN65]